MKYILILNKNNKDNKNNASLDLAHQTDHNEVVKVLEQAQEDIKALCSAVKKGDAEEVNTLVQSLLEGRFGDNLSMGANVNVVDEDGKTPLHYAAQNNNEKIVVALIKAGANINVKDKDGTTPLNLATDDKIKTLLQPTEKTDPLDGSSTESEGVQEEEKEEKQVAEDKPEPDVTKKENSEEESQRKQDISGEKGTDVTTGSAQPVAPTESNAPIQSGDVQETTSTGEEGTAVPTQNNGSTTNADEGTGVSNGSQPTGSTQSDGGQTSNTSAGQGTAEHPTSAEPDVPTQNSVSSVGGSSTSNTAQTEEQPSSFFGSLFSILMNPFSLIGSFFGGFFLWLFGSDEPIQSSSESDQPVVSESPNNSGDDNII